LNSHDAFGVLLGKAKSESISNDQLQFALKELNLVVSVQ
jgi:hypothetical protein